jgi:hypothetical protein
VSRLQLSNYEPVEPALLAALADTPVILTQLPRQCGKTTLAQQVEAAVAIATTHPTTPLHSPLRARISLASLECCFDAFQRRLRGREKANDFYSTCQRIRQSLEQQNT